MAARDDREPDRLRPVTVEYGVQVHAEGSILMRMGSTHVLCAVSVEEGVPPFLQGSGQGWITAEYAMLPRATHSRGRRETAAGRSGRSLEIQRLIGRSLRTMVDLRLLDGYTLRVDCDVINADGSTRCVSITGAALALRQAIDGMVRQDRLERQPALLPLAAVSVGVVDGEILLDLDYSEDSRAEVDANVVMDGRGRFVEIQATAEGMPFSRDQFDRMTELAARGIDELLALWKTD